MRALKYVLLTALSLQSAWGLSVTTCHYDATRQNYNPSETTLTPSYVAAGTLGRTGTWVVDDSIYGCLLYLPGIATTQQGVKTLIIATTLANSVYAFDATVPGSPAIWHVNFGAPATATTFNLPHAGGITSGPVADIPNNWLFVVTGTSEGAVNSVTRIHRLSLSDGSETIPSVIVAAHVTGTGETVNGIPDDTTGSQLNLHSAWQAQRTPLLLQGGTIYFGFGATNEFLVPYHGWLLAYSEALTQVAVWCSTPNSNGGGIWMASGGISGDGTNVYFATGNGPLEGGGWDGITEFSQSIMKLRGSDLSIVDWFTAATHEATTLTDSDVASGRVMLAGNYAVLGSKDGRLWSILRSNMGHLQGTGAVPNVITMSPVIPGAGTAVWGGSFGNNVAYMPYFNNGNIFSFSFDPATGLFSPLAKSPIIANLYANHSTDFNFYTFVTISSNAGASTIAWTLYPFVGAPNTPPGNSTIFSASDPLTMATHMVDLIPANTGSSFMSPLVVDGHVYIGGGSVVYAYGPITTPPGAVSPAVKLGTGTTVAH